ncbi:MAG: F0F1 ATP synthase subunit gamma [Gammaproteobacteria bacterium]
MSRSRELRQHIRQLKEIRNILNSMKNMALMETSKLSRFLALQSRVVENIETAAADFIAHYPLIDCPPDTHPQVYLLFGSERGFCGDFNEALIRAAGTCRESEIIGVGRKLCQSLERFCSDPIRVGGANVAEEASRVLNDLAAVIGSLQKKHAPLYLTAFYHDDDADRIVERRLLPPFQGLIDRPAQRIPPLLNLDPADFLADIIEHYLFAALHEIAYKSLMAENRQRLRHMEGAVSHLDNETDKMLKKSQTFRQEEITEEIEVILLTAESLV